MPQFVETLICPACQGVKLRTAWMCVSCDPTDLAIPADYPVDPMNADNNQTFAPCHHCHTLYSESVVECPRCGEVGHLDASACQSCVDRAHARAAPYGQGYFTNAELLARASIAPHPLRCDRCLEIILHPRDAKIVCHDCSDGLPTP